MKRTTLFAALLIASTAAFAQAPLEFKGVPLGATEEQLLAKYPAFRCDTDKGVRACSFFSEYSSTTCSRPGKVDPACTTSAQELLDMGGIQPKSYLAIIRNGAVAQVNIWFRTIDFSGIAAAFTEKYGKPTADNQSVVKNRMGAEFDNRLVKWDRNDGVLKVEQRGPDIETARIMMTAPGFYTEQRKIDEEKTKVAATKL